MPSLSGLPFGRYDAVQAALDLVVRRNEDFGQPMAFQAVVYTLVFFVTLATCGVLLLVALFTIRKRTLHDLASGLVVVRSRALTRALGSSNMQGGSTHA